MKIGHIAAPAIAITLACTSAAQAASYECTFHPFLTGCPPVSEVEMTAMAMGNLETKALRCGFSAAPLSEALDAYLGRHSSTNYSLALLRAQGRSTTIDPYTLNCAEVGTMLRRWRSDLLRATK